jgi:hypothetical protein
VHTGEFWAFSLWPIPAALCCDVQLLRIRCSIIAKNAVFGVRCITRAPFSSKFVAAISFRIRPSRKARSSAPFPELTTPSQCVETISASGISAD